jgi:hypothetical protein
MAMPATSRAPLNDAVIEWDGGSTAYVPAHVRERYRAFYGDPPAHLKFRDPTPDERAAYEAETAMFDRMNARHAEGT